MASIGFTNFDDVSVAPPTIPEILAALSGAQKTLILEGFTEAIRPTIWRGWVADMYPTEVGNDPFLNKVPRIAIVTLYKGINKIEEVSRELMRGERIITPAIPPDPEVPGDTGTPAVYNTPPTTATALKNAIAADFADIFTATQVTAVLAAMVKESKKDGSGTWAYYKAEVIK